MIIECKHRICTLFSPWSKRNKVLLNFSLILPCFLRVVSSMRSLFHCFHHSSWLIRQADYFDIRGVQRTINSGWKHSLQVPRLDQQVHWLQCKDRFRSNKSVVKCNCGSGVLSPQLWFTPGCLFWNGFIRAHLADCWLNFRGTGQSMLRERGCRRRVSGALKQNCLTKSFNLVTSTQT